MTNPGVLLEPASPDQPSLVSRGGGVFSADQARAGEFVFVVGVGFCIRRGRVSPAGGQQFQAKRAFATVGAVVFSGAHLLFSQQQPE